MDVTGIVFFVIVVIGFIYALIKQLATGTPISDTLLENMPGSDPRPSYPGESEASKNIRRTRADIIAPVSAYEWAEYEWRLGDLAEQETKRREELFKKETRRTEALLSWSVDPTRDGRFPLTNPDVQYNIDNGTEPYCTNCGLPDDRVYHPGLRSWEGTCDGQCALPDNTYLIL